MRDSFLIIAICLALLPMAIKIAHGQEMQPLYAVVDYIYADDASVYLEHEQRWKTLHQEMVKEGMLVYWGLFRVAYPRGSAQSYNYATVRIHQDFSQVEDGIQEGMYRAKFEEKNQESWTHFIATTSASREIVKGEVFELISTTGNDYGAMGRYVEVDYMDTPEGEEAAYIMAENKYWKPMQEERIAKGLMTGWDLWGLKYPSGTYEPYDYVTINFFDTYSKLTEPDYPPDVIAGAHPTFGVSDFDRIVQETLETRSMVQMQLWIRIDQTLQTP